MDLLSHFDAHLSDAVLDSSVLPNEEVIKNWFKGKLISVCGLPGAGKGTHCSRIAQRYGVIHMSTGDLFREEVKNNTEVGKIIGPIMALGQFVPPVYANKIIADRLCQKDCRENGILLDGFPRSVEHLNDLDDICKQISSRSGRQKLIDRVLFLGVDEEEAVKRVAGRRICTNCNAICNLAFLGESNSGSTCLQCHKETLIKRADDAEDIVRKRCALAKEHLGVLLQEVYQRDLLLSLTGKASLEKTTEKIIELLMFPERFTQKLTPSQKLGHIYKSRMQDSWSDEEIKALVLEFRDASLQENVKKRTGVMRRWVYLATTNLFKLQEFTQSFDKYGIEVLQLPPLFVSTSSSSSFIASSSSSSSLTSTSFAASSCSLSDYEEKVLFFLLSACKTSELVPMAVLCEESSLLQPHSKILSTQRPGVLAEHFSVLHAWTLNTGKKAEEEKSKIAWKTYAHGTLGKLVEDKGKNAEQQQQQKKRRKQPSSSSSSSLQQQQEYWGNEGVFGWDDRFVLLSTGKTYQEHRQVGLKISSRDMTISMFLAEKVYYKQLKNLSFTPIANLSRPVDFTVDVYDFIQQESYYNSSFAVSLGLRSLLTHVLNEGIFFKAADTRIEMNYWQPGLNAGIPLISKKDNIHERTFMFHDFGHFLMKDLIFTGQDSALHRSLYIISRMISEAITIMLADGLFVFSLEKQGIKYDFSTRKIYPLFLDCGLDFEDKINFLENLRKLTKASVDYTVKGDDTTFSQLLKKNNKDDTNLVLYKEKFKPFFVSDLTWTAHNYDNMKGRAIEMRKWWRLTEKIRNKFTEQKGGPLESIDEFLESMSSFASSSSATASSSSSFLSSSLSLNELVDSVFDVIFEKRVAPVFTQEVSLQPKEQRIRRGFTRYIIGQMGIFARFESFSENEKYFRKIEQLVLEDAEISVIRKTYEEYVCLLSERNLITIDDKHNYVEIYPLFEPFYVTYDKKEEYPDLALLAQEVIDLRAHRVFQMSVAEKYIHRALSTQERRYFDSMATIIESGGGQIDKGLFVTRPGVLLLSIAKQEDNCSINIQDEKSCLHASFLISGISIETSLELVAHKEASVARLTSSKTQAMNVPFFRIQGSNNESIGGSISYLKLFLTARASFERREDPRNKWGAGARSGEDKSERKKNEEGIELFNLSQAGSKCTCLVYTMSVNDFHKMFVGRMGEQGNEMEVREVVRMMCTELHALYPSHISTPSEYLSFSNGAKYTSSSASLSSSSPLSPVRESTAQIIADTMLTSLARRLFAALYIDTKQTDSHQLSEFASRITYLAFPQSPPFADSSKKYLRKLLFDNQHLSVVAACRVSVAVSNISLSEATSLHALVGTLGAEYVFHENSKVAIVTASLKVFHVLLSRLWQGALRDLGVLIHTALHTRHSFVIRENYDPIEESKKRKMDFSIAETPQKN